MTTGGMRGDRLFKDKDIIFSPAGTAGREGRRILVGSEIRRQSFLSFPSLFAISATSSEAGVRYRLSPFVVPSSFLFRRLRGFRLWGIRGPAAAQGFVEPY